MSTILRKSGAKANIPGPCQVTLRFSPLGIVKPVHHWRGTQVADAVASGFYFALRVNRYRETEIGYLPHLKKTIYRHRNMAMGYGLKIWPEDFATVKSIALEALNLEGL